MRPAVPVLFRPSRCAHTHGEQATIHIHTVETRGLVQSPADRSMWIGVDVGATKVRAVAMVVGQDRRLAVVRRSGRLEYTTGLHFQAVPLARQLEDRRHGDIHLRGAERRQGGVVVRTAAEAICLVAGPESRARVGLCVAGLKDEQGAGVVICVNGPRMPQFSADLERALCRMGRRKLRLTLPLGSDGHCSAMAEDAWHRGRLRTVRNAYYAGAGTGLAEAVKVDGTVLSMDEVAGWYPKAWQLRWPSGESGEAHVSAGGLMRHYARISGRNGPQPGATVSLLSAAVRNDHAAQGALTAWALDWARFLALRTELWDRAEGHGRLQRVVLGQRAGKALAAGTLRPFFREPLEHELKGLLRGSARLSSRYLPSGRLPARFVVGSGWMEAPAVGAAVLAMRRVPTAGGKEQSIRT